MKKNRIGTCVFVMLEIKWIGTVAACIPFKHKYFMAILPQMGFVINIKMPVAARIAFM